MTRRMLILLVLALLLAVPGCGGDDEPETAPPLPDLTLPQTDPEPPPATETAPETETVPPAIDEGTQTPQTETTPDSPQNDTPPPADSPAQRFEEFCNENPGTRACG